MEPARSPTHDGSAVSRQLCAHFRTVTSKYESLADFKRIPAFRAPLVEVKEAVIMIDRTSTQCGLLTC